MDEQSSSQKLPYVSAQLYAIEQFIRDKIVIIVTDSFNILWRVVRLIIL